MMATELWSAGTVRGSTAATHMTGLCAWARFEELSRRESARTAILFAFDLIEHDGDGRLRRRGCCAMLRTGILINDIIEDGADSVRLCVSAWG
jgi:hypothetical protein